MSVVSKLANKLLVNESCACTAPPSGTSLNKSCSEHGLSYEDEFELYIETLTLIGVNAVSNMAISTEPSSPCKDVSPEEAAEQSKSFVERESSDDASYVTERRRWVVLAAFSFANFSNSMLWVTRLLPLPLLLRPTLAYQSRP